MNNALTTLFALELRRLIAMPIIWLITLLLGLSFIMGANNTHTLHLEQVNAIVNAAQNDADLYEQLEERASRYAQPSSEALPYWQDPTDIAGFTRYFLQAHAAKPHLPLSTLSMGQSDLLPYLMPMKLETPFGIEPAYDFEAPRSLAIGTFDMGFAIVYLLPIAAITLISLLGSYERDHGILRLIASQSLSPRAFLALRIVAIGILVVPLIVFYFYLALLLNSAPISSALPQFFLALALVVGYTVFWLAAGFLALSLHQGAAATAGMLTGAFLVLALGVPLSASLVGKVFAPAPSQILSIDKRRQVDDTIETQWDELVTDWLAANGRNPAAPAPTYAAEMTIIAPEREKLLATLQDEHEQHQKLLSSWSQVVTMFSPPLALQQSLAILAGTDGNRHREFIGEVRAYQQQLRDYFYPRVQREILQARPSACVGCAGKLQFTQFQEIPQFNENLAADSSQKPFPWRTIIQILVLTSLMVFLACKRSNVWRSSDLD